MPGQSGYFVLTIQYTYLYYIVILYPGLTPFLPVSAFAG